MIKNDVFLCNGPFITNWVSIFPEKWPGVLCFYSHRRPGGILQRIHRFHRFHRFRNLRCRTDPGFPAPGARMTVVTQTPSN